MLEFRRGFKETAVKVKKRSVKMTMDSKLVPQQNNANALGGKPVALQPQGAAPGAAAAAATPPPPSGPAKLFVSSLLEPKDDFDEKHERCYNIVMSLIVDKSEKDAHDALSSTVSKDPKTHEEVCVGFLVAILSPLSACDPEQTGRHYRDLTLVSRDGLQCVLAHLNHLIVDKFLKMYPSTKQQLMWLIRELIRTSVVGMDTVCWNLMRQVAGGDVSKNNLWLADVLVDIFSENRSWLDKHSFLVASVAYTFLRLIEDHVHPNHEKLREKEIKFVVALMRERWNDVAVIGRDLLRLLQYVAKIPEFETLWRDILYQPRTLSPSFGGFIQLMHTRTSRRFLQSRITPEMEKKLVFLTAQVIKSSSSKKKNGSIFFFWLY